MAQQPLSPKKYIQTRARTLPIYKCLVNPDWRTADIASVIVMRRHVNGNVTAGAFLVDLLCLGVKDTQFWFNVDETAVTRYLPEGMMEEIDYSLAHNIVFAGHDFAQDYGIQPHADFAVTKFILQPDDDAVPLVEVHVGNAKGQPCFVATHPGQYSAALAALRKNAGEGQFEYRIGEDEPDDDQEYGATPSLSDFEPGTITLQDAKDLRFDDLLDDEQLKSRSIMERLTLIVERYLRTIFVLRPQYFLPADEDSISDSDWEAMTDTLSRTAGSTAPAVNPDEIEQPYQPWITQILDGIDNTDELELVVSRLLAEYRAEPFKRMMMADALLSGDKSHNVPGLWEDLEILARDYNLPRLMLGLLAAFGGDRFSRFALPVEGVRKLAELFPGQDGFHRLEHHYFYLLRLKASIAAADLSTTVGAYGALVELDEWSFTLTEGQLAFAGFMPMVFERIEQEMGGEPA